MGEVTAISWADGTKNFWWGCTKWSPGCDFCYAESLDHRLGGDHWGKGKPRREFKDKSWNEPLRWNEKAKAAGKRMKVFAQSMADWADAEVPNEWRERMWDIIRQCDWIDWLMLTKRAENIAGMLPADWGKGWPGVWMGVTVEDQARSHRRISDLIQVPAQVSWLSVEPQIGALSLRGYLKPASSSSRGISWLVQGGESGPPSKVRPFDLSWARTMLGECREAGAAYFMKQVGSRPILGGLPYERSTGKGDNPDEWPEDLRVREFPEVRT